MSNGNRSFTYVQNVSTVEVQDLNADRLSAASVIAGSVVVLPTVDSNGTPSVPGTLGQLIVDIHDPANPAPYFYTTNGWVPF
jgi:hypothetical protein